MTYTAEKAMTDAGDKIGDDIKKPIQEKIDALKAVKDGEDIEKIKTATEELSKEMQKIGEVLNKQAQEAAGAEGAPQGDASTQGEQVSAEEGAPKEEKPVEGEYEEVKK